MSNGFGILLFLAAWILIMKFILPRMGVPT